MNRRELIKTAAGAALAAGSYATQTTQTDSAWYRSLLVGVEIGPTGANDKDSIYMASAHGKNWVDALYHAHAQYGVVFMKDQNFAYYNSRIAPKCPNLGSMDLLRECLDAARDHAIPIVAYCQIQYDAGAWAKNPNWRMKRHDGKDIENRLCYRSGYLEYNKAIAAEMMEYPISGFHFDMLDFGFTAPYGCFCDRCQADFLTIYGERMPQHVSWNENWDNFLQFRGNSNTQFSQQLQKFVRAKRPDISVDFNYHGYPPFNWMCGEKPVQHAANGDFVTAEGLPWIFGHTNPSLLSLFMAGARPDGRAQGVTSRSVYNYHDFSVRPTAEMTWEVLTYLSHGAQCTIVDKANYDGTLDPICYDRIRTVFEETQAKSDLFGHRPVPEVGLYYSCRSRDWFGRENTAKYMNAFAGAHRALLQAHIPMGIIMDESVTLERLTQFPIVYLPNATILSEHECSILEEYVTAGGNVLATGLTGTYDHQGNPRNNSSLGHLFGVRFLGYQTEHQDNYLRLPLSLASGTGSFLLQDIPPDWPILTYGPIAIYESQGAETFGELMTAYRPVESQWSQHMSPKQVASPAVFVNKLRKGTGVLIPCSPDAAFLEMYRVPEHRNLLRNVLRYLNPNPAVRIEGSANVESIVTRDESKNRLLIHTLCFSAPATAATEIFGNGRKVLPPVMEEAAWYQVTITSRQRFSTVRATSPRSKLTVNDNQIHLFTDAIHEVVILEM